jgi:CYTH domain-containing protein
MTTNILLSIVFLCFIGLLGYLIKWYFFRPKEIERKFLVRNFSFDLIPDDAVSETKVSDIFQDYLVSEPGKTRRVRRSTTDGETTYTYTEKRPTKKRGTCFEDEEEISEAEYRALLAERDLATRTIHKMRYTFWYWGHWLELDVFANLPDYPDLVMLEVELKRIKEPLELPPEMDLEEVTDDHHYKNRALAAL